jgi:tRNA(Ile2)-agmatinylcytidine synthase
MLVGIDDTDSTRGMCTTYLAALLCRRLDAVGLPSLVRLNPNIPYKTRGNAALAFETSAEDAKEVVLSYVKERSVFDDERTNPGVAFLEAGSPPKILGDFYRRAVSELVTVDEALEAAGAAGAECHMFKNGRGVIGALAAIGFGGDATYEAIAYRSPDNWGAPRGIDPQSVYDMDRRLFPRVFDNLSPGGRRILITPKGRDPIFCGIRGVSSEVVESAWEMVRPLEPIELVQVFRTNQATDAHLRRKKVSEIRPYDCVTLDGTVTSAPRTLRGGHVVFTVSDQTGSIDCAVYRQGGTFRKAAAALEVGDEVEASGGIGKYPGTLNLEKMVVKSAAEGLKADVPACCGKNMTSAGKGKGYKCKKCGRKLSQKEVKVIHTARGVFEGTYDAPPGSRRHISKPAFLA